MYKVSCRRTRAIQADSMRGIPHKGEAASIMSLSYGNAE